MACSRLLFIALLASLLCVLSAGCASNSSQLAPAVAPVGTPPLSALPALPSGLDDVRHGSIVDNDTALGDAFIDSQNTSGAAGVGHFDGDLGMSWAIYQIAKRPDPAVPFALTINARYFDPLPQLPIPGKGYYVAWSNYTAGRWEFSGPYMQDQARILLPSSMVSSSAGGFIYAVVVLTGIQKCDVSGVQIGYSTGFGYEDYTVGAPQGEGTGAWCDIQLDPAGEPQIAYLHGTMIGGTKNSHVRVATLNAGNWELMDVDTPYIVTALQFAIGSNGLRALAVQEDVTHNLHVLVDDGSGTFSHDYTVIAPNSDTVAGITFINSADNPAGDLDTVLCIYAAPAGAPNVQTSFFRLTMPAGLPTSGLLLPVNSQEPGRLSLSRRADGLAVCAVPIAPALPQWDAAFGTFSALTDTWGFAVGPNWTNLDVADSNYQPEVVVRELSGGQLAAGYVMDKESGIIMSQLSGGLWSSDPADTIYTAHMELLDFEPFPDGRVGVLAQSPTMGGTLYIGAPASGGWQPEPLIPFPLGDLWSALAIDTTGVCHIAIEDPAHGIVFYARREADGTYDTSAVDIGGEASGISPGPVSMSAQGDSLHLYYTDINHYKILHSENKAGVWIHEGEVVNQDSFGEYPLGSGYLAGLDLLWVAYLNPIDYSIWAASKHPAAAEWQANLLMMGPQEFGAFAASNTELGVVSLQYFMGDNAFSFAHGDPRQGPFTPELLTFNIDVTGIPWLAYDPHASQWLIAGNSNDEHAALFFVRPEEGEWIGPSTVALQPGPTGQARSMGLLVKPDGTRFVAVREQPDASNTVFARVYSAPADSTAFSLYGNISAYDTTLGDVGMFVMAAAPTGEPIVGISHKANVDPTWSFSAYVSDGTGNFPPGSLWTSTINEPVSFFGSFAVAAINGGVALAAAEDDETSPNYGRVFTHYPW